MSTFSIFLTFFCILSHAFNIELNFLFYLLNSGRRKHTFWEKKEEHKLVEYFKDIIKGESKQTMPSKYKL